MTMVPSLLRLVFVFVIFPNDDQHQPAAPADGDQETNHRDAGATENLEWELVGGFQADVTALP